MQCQRYVRLVDLEDMYLLTMKTTEAIEVEIFASQHIPEEEGSKMPTR